MAVKLETRTYATIEDCPSCDWYVSKTVSIEAFDGCRIRCMPVARLEGQTYAEINMNRNDFIRYAAQFRVGGICAKRHWL